MKTLMKSLRIAAATTMVAALALVVQSCGDSNPAAPKLAGAASHDLLGGLTSTLTKTVGLLTCKQKPAEFASATIGKDGGTISLSGATLTVPKGALAAPVTITAYAPKGNVDVVDFEPSGLVFAKSATLTMSYSNCNLLGSLLPKRIAYVDGGLNILYYLLSVDDMGAQTVTSPVDHFSDYAMAW